MLHSRYVGRFLRRAMHHPKDELRTAGKRVLVAGLGNYSMRGTRHSVGMAVLNHLANKFNVGNQWETDRQCHADIAIARLGDVELVLMKPRRFMNVNGLSIAGARQNSPFLYDADCFEDSQNIILKTSGKWDDRGLIGTLSAKLGQLGVETYKLGVENIYLVHDDLDKPLGKVALKMGGSARGHNGVRSCISSLRSDSMVRLRVGIGRPVGEISVDHYVLSRFTISEQKILPHVFEKATEMLLRHIQQNYSNQKDPATSEKKEAAKAPLKTETHNHH